ATQPGIDPRRPAALPRAARSPPPPAPPPPPRPPRAPPPAPGGPPGAASARSRRRRISVPAWPARAAVRRARGGACPLPWHASWDSPAAVVQSGAEIVCPERAGAECAAALPRAAVIQRLALRVRPSALALVSAILASPALLAGWNLDDHLFRHRLAAWPLRDVLMRLFVFWSGDAEETRQTMDRWGVPWWTDPGLRVAFWRPLTALTHWLDFRLWGDDPVAAHAQSLLWLVVLVARFYRRLLGPTTAAGLAAFFYAVDGARGAAVGWVASRNAILVVVCGVATLAQHDRWRRNGGRARARLRSLAPYLVLLVGWHALYQHLGYGTAGSGFYADPAREPLRFV